MGGQQLNENRLSKDQLKTGYVKRLKEIHPQESRRREKQERAMVCVKHDYMSYSRVTAKQLPSVSPSFRLSSLLKL